jgi:glycerophosphoryl diester phosphodiesterase
VKGARPRTGRTAGPSAARRVEVIAHRGFSGLAPENTLSAIREAIRAGADRVEFDVLLCAGGEPVVIHDADLERTTGSRGPVSARALAEIRALDAGGWFGKQFCGEKVPTLEEALEECRGRIAVNVEIKEEAVERTEGALEDGIEARVGRAIRRLAMADSAVVSSFEPLALVRLKRLAPEIPLQSLYDAARHRGLGPAAVCAAVGSGAFNCSREELSAPWIEEAHRAGLKVNVYTVDEPAEMERVIGLGVDGIFTNRPDRLLRLLGRPPGEAGRPAGSR